MWDLLAISPEVAIFLFFNILSFRLLFRGGGESPTKNTVNLADTGCCQGMFLGQTFHIAECPLKH